MLYLTINIANQYLKAFKYVQIELVVKDNNTWHHLTVWTDEPRLV